MPSSLTSSIDLPESKKETATSNQVLEYYKRNWKEIVSCYDLNSDGLPKDAAFYRRQIYLRILRDTNANNILDVGCGGGRTVLDGLQMGRHVRGIEPVGPLAEIAKALLADNGYNPGLIIQKDMSDLVNWENQSLGAVAALSVLPHVSPQKWDLTHQYLAGLICKGGYFIASYRNDLFDLYTFNSFTMDFIVNNLWSCTICTPLQSVEIVKDLKNLIQNADIPGPFYTNANDKSFGTLTRTNSNPLEMPNYLSTFDLKVLKTYFYNFHCTPPLLGKTLQENRIISHKMDMEMNENWRGHFMASTFVVLARKDQ